MRESMEIYPKTAAERAMKLQEVLLRATSGKIKWWQAAELIGISERQMRRWRKRYEEHGYDGLMDRRRGVPSSKRVPLAQVEQVLGLYRDRYFDLNVRHFHEKLSEEHQIGLSYTWVKQACAPASCLGTPPPAAVPDRAAAKAHRPRPVSASPAPHAASPGCNRGESGPVPAAERASPGPAADPASACDASARGAPSAPDARRARYHKPKSTS